MVKTRKIEDFTIINGDNQPHLVTGMEQYGENLFDIAMYHSTDKTYCVFSVGKDTNKFICFNLNYDDKYKTWLGFTPIKAKLVPSLIIQDLKDNFTNQ